jgi:hypothetical protein
MAKSRDQKLYNCRGRYFLDIIDDEMYSTNSYSLYYWYNQVFRDIDVREHTEPEKIVLREEHKMKLPKEQDKKEEKIKYLEEMEKNDLL